MYRQIILSTILVLLFAIGCEKSPISVSNGLVNLELVWENADENGLAKANESAGYPETIKVLLSPGDEVYTFDYDDRSGTLDEIEPGTYMLEVYALDEDHNITNTGSESSVVVNSGKATTVTITMRSFTPTTVYASTDDEDYITVTWNSISQASQYKVYRKDEEYDTFELVATTSSTYFDDYDVDQAKWYYYRVVATSGAGNSPASDVASGYLPGWRFSEVSLYDPNDGIGLYFKLYGYGFYNDPKTVSIYAVYEDYDNGEMVHRYIDGYGAFGYVAATTEFTPNYETTLWNDKWYLMDYLWDSYWRDNYYQQYVAMKVYKTDDIEMLNDSFYAFTGYYSFYWTTNSLGKPVIKLERKLTAEENEVIEKSLHKYYSNKLK